MSGEENLPPLRDVIEAHGLKAKKAFGQHFLLDLNLTRKIVRQAENLEGLTIIEIGPGPGGLTRALLESPAKNVLAIEMDRRFAELLSDMAEKEPRLRIITGDALEIDPVALTPTPRAIIANLPYNVGTALLTAWLQTAAEYEFFLLMFQKEVAERITARVGDDAYGRLSVLCQYTCDCSIAMHLPARTFTPAPKVDSAVVHLKPKKGALPVPIAALEQVTRQAFSQRRKMLRSTFKGQLNEEAFKALGIRSEARPEELSVADFVKLTKHLLP